MQDRAQGFARHAGRLFPRISTAVLLSFLLVLLAATASAQVSTASVNGTIRDPQGAVIPGAAIVLRSLDTSLEHSSVSNSAGTYVILNIPPGRYTIQVQRQGV